MTKANADSPLKVLAENLVMFGRSHGADQIEVTILEGNEFSVDVRLGQIENLCEAGARGLSLRVIKDQRTAYASSSDLDRVQLENLVENAIRRAELASIDECAGLPRLEENQIETSALLLNDPAISVLDPKEKIELALETERIGLSDKRITNSYGASFETRVIRTTLVNSFGFSQEYEETFCSLGLGLQAGETDNKVEGSWSSVKRIFKDLETPEKIASTCVERTVRQLNARKIQTQVAPVVFEPPMTSWLLGFLFACVSGSAIYQKTSFLADRLGEKVAGEEIYISDDGLMPGMLGTTPFDSEGVSSQKTKILDKGILKNYLCNTYAARKLKLRSTGNADGGGIGPHNFYLHAGTLPPEKIVSTLDRGLILIRTLGHGLNPINGDISRGAFGLWVEKGEIVYPVSEITISGNLGRILNSIEKIGNDVEFRSSVVGPTIQISELTIAGS
ncbi:MAG: TldD/PmbA family protein [Candidatus Aminicenantaceae bacterium]